eukprot:jgi/Pico_ML_1/51190/g2267.t1
MEDSSSSIRTSDGKPFPVTLAANSRATWSDGATFWSSKTAAVPAPVHFQDPPTRQEGRSRRASEPWTRTHRARLPRFVLKF